MRISRFLLLLLIVVLSFTSGCALFKTVSNIASGKGVLDKAAVVVPFDPVNGAILVPIKINDNADPFIFMIDTGRLSAISPEVADKLSLEKLMKVVGRNLKDEITDLDLTTVNKIEIGKGVFMEHPTLQIMSMSRLQDRAGVFVDGIIGNNILFHFETTIDYFHQKLIFQMPTQTNIDQIMTEGDTYVMPFNLSVKEGLTPKIKGRINGTVNASFTISTGTLGDTFIEHDLASYLGYLDIGTKLEVAELNGEPLGGYTGLYQQPIVGMLKSLNFGAMDVGPHLFYSAQSEFNLLGYSVLKNYRITLNYEKSMVVFKEHPQPELHSRLYNCGLAIGLEDGRYVITGLVKNSAADKSGIHPFDEVLELNGKKVSDIGLLLINRILQDENITKITLVLKGPEENRIIVLERLDLLKLQQCEIGAPDGNPED